MKGTELVEDLLISTEQYYMFSEGGMTCFRDREMSDNIQNMLMDKDLLLAISQANLFIVNMVEK